MNNTELIARLRKLSAENRAPRDAIDEAADALEAAQPAGEPVAYTYSSTQATKCAGCGEHKHTPLRIDAMDGYVCLTCIDQKLGSLLGEFGYPEATHPAPQVPMTDEELYTAYLIHQNGPYERAFTAGVKAAEAHHKIGVKS